MNRLRTIKSFDGFSEKLREQNPRLVVVQAKSDLKPTRGLFDWLMSPAAGNSDFLLHGLLYTVDTARKRRERVEPILSTPNRENVSGDNVEHYKRSIQLLLAGEVRVDFLRSVLPETEVYLAGVDPLQPMSKEKLSSLHEKAQKFELEVPKFLV
jgi:hypothetical protein